MGHKEANNIKIKGSIDFGNIFKQLIMVVVAILVLYPLIFVFMTSFKTNMDVITRPFTIHSFKPENYVNAWVIGRVGKYFFNSVITTAITLSVQLTIIIFGSYAFGKLKPWGHKYLFTLYLTGLFITTEMITVPNFMTIKNLGLMESRMALILPYISGGIALATFIMTNFIKDLPKELDEAALIDGCGVFKNLIFITIPLMKPVIATVTIFNFQQVWSEFYWALIIVRDEAIKTLPLGLINFQSQYNTEFGVLSAGLTILIIPVLIVYLLCSNYFIGGMTSGAVKG